MAHRLRPEEIVTIHVLKEKGASQREIARRLGVSEGAVRYQLKRPVEGREDGRRRRAYRDAELLPQIRSWTLELDLGERPFNVRELHEHLVERIDFACDEAAYRRLLRLVRAHFPKPKMRTYRRVETPPGAQTQSDWGEYPRVDVGDGPEALSAFTMVLSHSRMPSIIWERSKNLLSWLHAHNESFVRLGGVAAVNRIDNVKTALSQGAGPWATKHPVYAAYARSLGFHIDPCLPRSPEAKGKSEAKVRLSRLLVGMPRKRFASLEELQHFTDEKVEKWATKALCPITGESVIDTWKQERELLTPLPPQLPEPFDITVRRPVRKDCTVHFEGRQYTVPFAYVGRHVEVRGCLEKVQLLFEDKVLREYPRKSKELLLLDPSCFEGESTDRVTAPMPLGRAGRRLQEILDEPVAKRALDIYEAMAEALQ